MKHTPFSSQGIMDGWMDGYRTAPEQGSEIRLQTHKSFPHIPTQDHLATLQRLSNNIKGPYNHYR